MAEHERALPPLPAGLASVGPSFVPAPRLVTNNRCPSPTHHTHTAGVRILQGELAVSWGKSVDAHTRKLHKWQRATECLHARR